MSRMQFQTSPPVSDCPCGWKMPRRITVLLPPTPILTERAMRSLRESLPSLIVLVECPACGRTHPQARRRR